MLLLPRQSASKPHFQSFRKTKSARVDPMNEKSSNSMNDKVVQRTGQHFPNGSPRVVTKALFQGASAAGVTAAAFVGGERPMLVLVASPSSRHSPIGRIPCIVMFTTPSTVLLPFEDWTQHISFDDRRRPAATRIRHYCMPLHRPLSSYNVFG